MTYGQVDLQQHCLAFIESCTAVRPRGGPEMGAPQGMGSKRGHGTGEQGREDGVAGGEKGPNGVWGGMLRDE